MIHFVTALAAEARPIIDTYGLKRKSLPFAFEYYENDGVRLVVTGMGKLKSAVATSWLLCQAQEHDKTIIVNVGIAGTASKQRPIGQGVLIHALEDHSTGRHYYPEMLIRHDFPEGKVTTFDWPVGGVPPGGTDLVDMEATGFFVAATTFVPIPRVFVLKVVSDHLETGIPEKAFVSGLIQEQIAPLQTMLEHARELTYALPKPLDAEEEAMIEAIGDNLHLSTTQKLQLGSMAKSYKIGLGKPLKTTLSRFKEMQTATKEKSKETLERIRKILAQS